MFENNPKSKPTMAQKIAWLKREIPWSYQIEDAKGMMRESSGYLPAHELEKDQALTAEVLNSIPAEDRTHWRSVREEIVRDHLKAGRSKAVEVVNAELAYRVTRHYPHADIDVSIMRKVHVDDVINADTGEVEQKHRMIAQDAYISWGDHEKNMQDAARFDPAGSKRPVQTPGTVTELAVQQQLQQHPPGSGVGGPSI